MPTNSAKATLAGVYLTTDRVIEWCLSCGTQPFQAVVECHKSAAKGIENSIGVPTSLEITDSDGRSLSIQNVYVLGSAPASRPWMRAFVVSDVRWLWRRRAIYRFYNHVRRTGDKYLLAGIPTSVATELDSFKYHDWSLKAGSDGSRRWDAQDILEDLMESVAGSKRVEGNVPDVPIQSLEEDDPGDVALRRVLDATGFNVFVGVDGNAIAFDARDLAAADAIISKALPIEGSVFPAKSDLTAIRPVSIRVLFNRECELRFDSLQEADTVTVNEDQRYMRNVIPVPDDQLEVNFDGHVRNVGRGTYVPLKAILDAWNEDLPEGADDLTLELLRKIWLRGNALEAMYCRLGEKGPTANWVMRIAALRQHFRVTYQLSHKWMRRIKGLRPYRLGIYDPLNGVHAPSQPFMDYAVQCSMKGILLGTDKQYLWLNIEGYPELGENPDGSQAKGAPAIVEVLDADVGIVHIAFKNDTLGLFTRYFPSLIVDEGGSKTVPTGNMGDWRTKPIAMDSKVSGTNGFVELSEDHKVCIVITAIPASPNTEKQFHDIKINASDLQDNFTGIRGAKGGNGPTWAVRVGPSIVNARILWQEDKDSIYARIFGLDANGRGIAGDEIPSDMIANKRILEATAKGTAVNLWADLLDRYDGSVTSHFNGSEGKRPRGNIDVVTFTLGLDGVLRTTLQANPSLRGVDVLAYMPDSVRTAVYRILPVGGA